MSASLQIGLLTPSCRGYNALDGGIASHFADLAAALAEQGHAVRVITEGPGTFATAGTDLAGVAFVPFDPRLPRWLDRLAGVRWQLHTVVARRHRLRSAARILRSEHRHRPFDAIETTSSGCLAHRLVTTGERLPLVTRVSTTAAQLISHNGGQSRWPDRDEVRLEAGLVRSSPSVITHTSSHRTEICREWGLAEGPIALIPHGIRIPGPRALGSVSPGPARRALFVGRLEHRKGIDVLLGAIPLVLPRVPGLQLAIAGHDPDGSWQRQFAESLGPELRARVDFLGRTSAAELQGLYRDCDFLVAPSRYESFGLTYVEAMAWGRPVIGCRVGGVPEVVADGETGLLVPPDDVAATAAAMLALAQQGDLRARLGASARARAIREFSRETLARRSAEHYRSLIRKDH